VGTFERKLDSSNRFRLPREILREFAPEMLRRFFCLSVSGECLLVFPPEPFREVIKRFSNAEISNPQHRQMARDLFANTENCRVDGAGRMMLATQSRRRAGIGSTIVLVGAGKYFEIWARERFDAQCGGEAGEKLIELMRNDGLAI
jgi:MraZ protein